jgi:6-phosphogluconate dehydrogenase (decarboxylating)
MQPGMIGLRRMGANLTRRLMRDGLEVVVIDVNAGSVRQLEWVGAVGARSLEEFVARLDVPRTAWIMMSAGFVQETVDRLAELLDAGDAIIDGNSYYRDDIGRWRAPAIASWLLDLTASALGKSPGLGGYSGQVSDSGEGGWTVAAAVDAGVLVNVSTTALCERFSSRGQAGFGDQLLSAMRREFGGRVEKAAAGAR